MQYLEGSFLVNILSILRGEAINILYIALVMHASPAALTDIFARDTHFAGASVEPNQYLHSSLQLVGAAQGVQRRGIPMVWSGVRASPVGGRCAGSPASALFLQQNYPPFKPPPHIFNT